MTYNFFNPTRVLFGAGQLENLHTQEMPGRKAMVVISNGKSTRESGALERVMEQMDKAGVETVLFEKVGANPLKAVVEEGGRFAQNNGCDFVVALGGGSVMDAAKIMAMYALQPGDLWDYVPGATGKMHPLVNPVLHKHCCDDRFVRMAQALGKEDAKEPMDFVAALTELQKNCGVDTLKMSDYGIEKSECMTLAQNARATMGGLFACDPVPMTDMECAEIFERSYR
mgnify:FL=1